MMVLVSGNVWAEEVIAGTGTNAYNNLPLYSHTHYSSTTECIYTPDELKGAGVILSIAYNANSINNTQSFPIEVYMRHRKSATYSNVNDYAPASSLTLVYSGKMSFKVGWNTIGLTTPFVYNGSDNLEVVVCKKSPSISSYNNNFFYCTSISNKTLYRYKENSNYGDITYPGDFSKNSYRPNTKFEINRKTYSLNGINYIHDVNGAVVSGTGALSGNVTIPNSIKPGDGKTYSVIGIAGEAFKNCSATSITIPSTVESIGNNAFEGCTKLKNLTFKSENPVTLASAGVLPYDITLYVPSSAVASYKAAEGWSEHKNQIMATGTKTDYDLTGFYAVKAETGRSVLHERIGEDHLAEVVTLKIEGTINSYDLMVMRNKMVRLKQLDLSKATIIANSYEYYTGYCSLNNTLTYWALNDNLYSVKLPKTLKKINSNSLTNLKNITELEIPASVTEIADYAANGLKKLKVLIFANNSQCETIGEQAFYGCSSLTSLSIPAKVTRIGTDAFYNCSSLKELAFEDGESIIELKGIKSNIGYYIFTTDAYNNYTPFRNCPIRQLYIGRKMKFDDYHYDYNYYSRLCLGNTSLQSVEFGEYVSVIDAAQFAGCTNLKEVKGLENIKSIGEGAFHGCSRLESLTIPSNVTKIEPWAFRYSGLKSMNIPAGVTSLGDYAFADCTNLKEVKGLENIKSIGEGAFYKCSSLESLTIPSSVTKIEPWAFRESGLKSMNIPAGVTSLGGYAFADCPNLEKFTFSDDCELTAIPNYFLYNAVKLDNIALPKKTLTIGHYAFYGCTLMKECKISSKITKIGDYAFNQCNNLNSVYAYTFEPQAIDQNTFSTYHTATLHIPSASYLLYFYDTQWSQFLHLVGFDSEAEQVGINVDYHLYTETNGIIGGKPRVDISVKGGLTVIGDKIQPFGDIHIAANDKFFGSLIANGNVTADKIYFDINVNKDKWYFFCFPFDIPLANITKAGSYKWAMYDGNARATKGTTGWKNLPSGTKILKKGQGYIFRTSYESELSIRVDNPTFEAVNEQTTLTSYVGTNEANANWNMVGNPYPCYYPINKLQYGAPIIVWNGKGYDAYRPGDDDYILHPFEAMFVQKPQMVSSVGFLAEWRQTYSGSHPVSRNAKPFGVDFAQSSEIAENSRRFINLTLSHGEQVDKTRIVFNEAQSVSYEQECDAAKFESFDSPQLYSMGADGVKFAINERPVDNGKIALGFYAPEEGMYTFSTTRMDVNAYIYDAKTAKTYDLSDGEFTFNAEQGTDNGRFTLIFADETTDISGVLTPNEGADKVYDLNGRKMNDAKTGIVIKNGKKVVVK